MRFSTTSAVVSLCFAAGHALGVVTINSSVTTAHDFVSSGGAPSDYSDTATYVGTGPGNPVTPHGNSAKSDVSTSSIYGKFSGQYISNAISHITSGHTGTLVTLFTTTTSINVHILLNGNTNYGGSPKPKPEQLGAYFVIYNNTTNAVVFDSYTIGEHAMGMPPNNYTRWINATWDGVLAAGTYKVLTGATGTDVPPPSGPGAGSSGSAQLEGTMTITIPSPAPLALLALAAIRRRR